MPELTTRKEEAVERYLRIKEAGTVQDLCREFGISKPTLLSWVSDLAKKDAPASGTGTGQEPRCSTDGAGSNEESTRAKTDVWEG